MRAFVLFVLRLVRRRDLSVAWVREIDRRDCSRGIDQACWQTWPYRREE